MQPYSPKAVANAILAIAEQAGSRDITPMKLQKLIYYAHAWSLALLNTPLINQEIQAWTYGPVIEDIYHAFKNFGNTQITGRATELGFANGQLSFIAPEIEASDTQAISLINEIWRIYGSLSPIQLSNMTHTPDSPWYEVASKYSFNLPMNVPIPNELIQAKFREKHAAGQG